MDIWLNIEINEGQPFPSTHLTEQSALTAQVEAILEFLDAEHDDNDPTQWHSTLANWGLNDESEVWKYDITMWRNFSLKELWKFRNHIVELTWDAGCVDYCIERTEVMP